MALTFYVDGVNGSDSYSGLSWNSPYKTFVKALSQIDEVSSKIFLASGTYYEGELDDLYNQGHGTTKNLAIEGVGDVWFDLAGFDYWIKTSTSGISSDYRAYYFRNINFRNTETQIFDGGHGNYGEWHYFCHCRFLQTGVKYGAGQGISPSAVNNIFQQCTIFGIDVALSNEGRCYLWHSIILGSTPKTGTASAAYSASNQSEYRGTGGWDTATYPPPFVDADTDNPNLDFDSTHAQFEKYMTSGEFGDSVGTPGGFNLQWTQGWDDRYHSTLNLHLFDLNTNPILGGWVNDNDYYNTDWEDIIISSSNNKIDFDEGGGEVTATIADGTYSSGTDFATAIETAMDAAATADIGVAYGESDTLRLTLSSDGATFSLLCNSGTNLANAAWSEMGIDTTADKTGLLVYSSDHGVVAGPGAGAPDTASPILWNDTIKAIKINFDVEPNGISARTISPVCDVRRPMPLSYLSIARQEEDTGAVDSEQATSTRKIEVRGDNASFNATDPAGSTDLDWTEYEYGTAYINQSYRFWQFRVVLRLDATA